MGRVVYVNGAYRPHAEALVHFEDRGYQFSDGVYEVVLVRSGKMVDAAPHLARLGRSLGELEIQPPMAEAPLRVILNELIRRNRIREGFVYAQATRGVAPRDHVFPGPVKAALVCSARARSWPAAGHKPAGQSAITVRDERWARCDIKSVGLLANILAKQKAKKAGAAEAIFIADDGIVREGGSSNVWIVDEAGALHTHPLGPEILGGVTRAAVKSLAAGAQIQVKEERFDREFMQRAKEMFVTSATSFVKPITSVDGTTIGNGAVGPVTQRMFDLYNDHTLSAAD
jgi:D-alanine transaminase